jgi:hypothetical protein
MYMHTIAKVLKQLSGNPLRNLTPGILHPILASNRRTDDLYNDRFVHSQHPGPVLGPQEDGEISLVPRNIDAAVSIWRTS